MKLVHLFMAGCMMALVLNGRTLILAGETPAAKFAGEWTNTDSNTRSVTRIDIRIEEGRVVVHMWGKCHPRDCDWGENTARLKGQTLSLSWTKSFSVRTQELKLLKDGRLQLKGHTHFTDSSGREDYDSNETFAKGAARDGGGQPSNKH